MIVYDEAIIQQRHTMSNYRTFMRNCPDLVVGFARA